MKTHDRTERPWRVAPKPARARAVFGLVAGLVLVAPTSYASESKRDPQRPPAVLDGARLDPSLSGKMLEIQTRRRLFDALPTGTQPVPWRARLRDSARRATGSNPDDRFWSAQFKRPGFDDRVLALATYQGALVAGGDFAVADSVHTLRVARWDGTAWRALGSGLSDVPEDYNALTALLPYGGDLIAGGTFRKAGDRIVNGIARWNGDTWQELGGGMAISNPTGADVARVQCLVEFEGDLVAGGLFDRVHGMPTPGLARWNGSSWSPFGTTPIRQVFALAIHEGSLFAACDFVHFGSTTFSGVVRWDGTGWIPVGERFIGPVRALAVYRGDLVAGAAFGAPDIGPASHLARWDGSAWQALGGGLRSNDPGGFGVMALAVHDDRLVVGGKFAFAGSVPATAIAAWDGTGWSNLGSGMHLPLFGPSVHALHVHEGSLVAGGDFTHAGDAPAEFVARWDGGGWNSLGAEGFGMDGLVVDLMEYEGKMLAAGRFQQAGSIAAPLVARWDAGWAPLGRGLRPDSTGVNALASHAGALHAAVTTASGDSSLSFLARWNGSEWLPISPPTSSFIDCLIEYEGDLVAGGWFTHAGSVLSNGIARWDGSAWAPLGTGMSGRYRPIVRAVTVFRGDLVAAGTFDRAGGVEAANIARWDGSNWAPLDAGLSGVLYANIYGLETYAGDLVAVGEFDRAGDVPVRSIARWDGAQWHAIGEGPEGDWDLPPFVVCAASHGEHLVVGGLFERSGGSLTQNIARWDGHEWRPLGSGLDDVPVALEFMDGALWAGGWFGSAGNKHSARIAHWSDPIVPVLVHDFIALEEDGGVRLSWSVSEPEELASLDVERAASEPGPWKTITPMPLAPERVMAYVDASAAGTSQPWYRLRLLDANGVVTWIGPARVVDRAPTQDASSLHAPIVPADGGPIRLRYEIGGRPVRIELAIFDVRGRAVRQLEQGLRQPGAHEAQWDRRTVSGELVPRGVYFVQLRSGPHSAARKLVHVW